MQSHSWSPIGRRPKCRLNGVSPTFRPSYFRDSLAAVRVLILSFIGGYDGGHMMTGDPVPLEELILKAFDAADLSDSPLQPQYDMQSASGETMLSLACSIGLHRVCAALLARGANPDVRDKAGYTPLMHTALHERLKSFQLLLLKGADPSIRSLSGYTALDLASIEQRGFLQQILLDTRRSRNNRPYIHSRQSTASFGTSDRSWDISSASFYESEVEGSEQLHTSQPPSRRQSAFEQMPITAEEPAEPPNARPEHTATEAMVAWRDALATQIQHFHETVQKNVSQIHLPAIPPLPDYHDSVRRLGSVFSSPHTPSLAPPPPYSELFPENVSTDLKKGAVNEAMVDAVADHKCATMFDEATEGSSCSTEYESTHCEKRIWTDGTPLWVWVSSGVFQTVP